VKLIFLDIDGVLNGHEFNADAMSSTFDRDKVHVLNRILKETDAKIVLTSAWRYLVHRGEMNLEGLNWLLKSHGIMDGRLAGITRMDTMERPVYRGDLNSWPATNERGRQITDWIAENLPDHNGIAYIAVDDLDLGIIEEGHAFIQTDPKVGLTHSHADKIIRFLNG
jgi:hypothetical protein